MTPMRESNDVLKRWSEFKTKELPAMNRMLRDAQVVESRSTPISSRKM